MMNTPYHHLNVGQRLGLVDAVDRLLDKGVVITGDATVSLAGVDLVYLRLGLMLASVERLNRETGPATLCRVDPKLGGDPQTHPHRQTMFPASPMSAANRELFREQNDTKEGMLPPAGPEAPSGQAPDEARDLARLVLTLVDMLRRVLERQALHRMEGGSVPDEDIEHMGTALMELDAKMDSLCAVFGLRREELEIDLGPLGKID